MSKQATSTDCNDKRPVNHNHGGPCDLCDAQAKEIEPRTALRRLGCIARPRD
jgi:hypothetical protein